MIPTEMTQMYCGNGQTLTGLTNHINYNDSHKYLALLSPNSHNIISKVALGVKSIRCNCYAKTNFFSILPPHIIDTDPNLAEN